MSTQIGEVTINLRMSLAQFKQDTQQGTQDASRATRQMASDMKGSSNEARGALMLLGEEIGVHIPRHLQAAIASIPGVGTALNAAFGSVAVLALIEVFIKVYEKLEDIKKKAAELRQAIETASEGGQKSFRALQEETLALQAEVEDLNGNHLKALQDRLQALDNQSLDKISAEMKELQTRADNVLDKLKENAFWAFLGDGNNKAVEGAKKDIQDITNQINDLKNAGGEGANAAIGKAIQKAIDDLHSRKGLNFQDDDITKVRALQQEDQYLQQLLRDYTQVNAQRAAKTTLDTAKTQETGEVSADQGLSAEKRVSDAKVQLAEDEFKRREATARDGYARLREVTLADIQADEDAARDAADAKSQNDVDYWEKIKANHTLNTEADKKIRESAEKQIELLTVQHEDALVRIETDGANRRGEVQKASILRADEQAKQDIQRSEEAARAKLAAEDSYYSGQMEHIKSLAALHQITSRQELADELALNQQRYDAELTYLATKVDDAAKILVIEANKNGQILSMDDALIQARKNLDADYLKAMQQFATANLKAADEHAKQLQQMYDSIANSFESSLNTMLTTGKSNWSSFFQSIESDLLKLIEKNLFSKLVSGFGSGDGGLLSSIGGGFSSLFSGLGGLLGLASGGPAYQGHAYMVGEDGPELFSPSGSGRIIPNGDLGGGDSSRPSVTNFTMHVHGVQNVDGFKASEGQIAARMLALQAASAKRNG